MPQLARALVGQSDESEAGQTCVVVRPLRARDVAALADLWVASWREAMPDIDFAARRAWIVAVLGAPEHTTLVVESAGAVAGFATLEGGTLHQLVVAPWAKGGGSARRLLDAAKAAAPEGLALDVNQANARAVRFYEREGFAIVGEGVNPGSGLATFAMRWSLATSSKTRYPAIKNIAYSKEAVRTLSRMPTNVAKLIRRKITQYAGDPASMANNVRALKGYDGAKRLRVGDWRVLFTESGEVIAIIRIAPRGDVYD